MLASRSRSTSELLSYPDRGHSSNGNPLFTASIYASGASNLTRAKDVVVRLDPRLATEIRGLDHRSFGRENSVVCGQRLSRNGAQVFFMGFPLDLISKSPSLIMFRDISDLDLISHQYLSDQNKRCLWTDTEAPLRFFLQPMAF